MDTPVRHKPYPTLDPVNDGRHALRDLPLERESVPYVVSLPEHGIGAFIYTWVTKDGLAGSAFVAYGPGVGETPIAVVTDNVPMPASANFDDWKVGGMHLRQDLKLHTAEFEVDTEAAGMKARFEALHPAYAYGFHAEGCPDYAATNRLEQAGRFKGSIRIRDKTYEFDTTCARDHSWGTRDWEMPQHWKWLHVQTTGQSSETCVHFWQIFARGRIDLRGYIFQDGTLAEVTAVDVDFALDEQCRQKRITAVVEDAHGRSVTVKGSYFGHFPFTPGPHTTLWEGAMEATVDGAKAVGWTEFMWPTAYLDYIKKGAAR